MTPEIVLVWLGTEAQLEASHAAIESWARARGVLVAEPAEARAPGAPSTGLAYDPELVVSIERDLELARIADAALDDDAARAALGRAARLLADHAELPQAAWLLAAHERLRASVERRGPGGEGAALAALARAEALEGSVAPTYGDAGARERAPAASAVASARIVRGLEPGETLVWNGEPADPRAVVVPPGRHHVVVLREATPRWAAWVEVATDQAELRLARPPIAACSADELARVRAVRRGVVGAETVRCGDWAVARPRRGGAIAIARCFGASCGPLLPWRASWGSTEGGRPQPSPPPDDGHALAWAVAGATAVAAGCFVAWRVGAFDRDPAGPPRFVYEAPR
ncbi:MAG: hypothetical protein IT376_20445 [Polyangiaceae bacterium]|nr:hypothetical protein [Polyangiaceae bacterium]